MLNNNKWKRIGSGILAVCLGVTLLLSNGSFGVFAKEDDTEDIQVQISQAGENNEVVGNTEKSQENTEEDNRFSDIDKSEEGTQESKDLVSEENDGSYAENGEETSEVASENKDFISGEEKNDVVAQSEDETSAIIFDLAKGKVVFQADNTYTGYDVYGNPIKGEHKDSNIYEIRQSGSESTDNTIIIETANMYGQGISLKNQGSTYNITLNGVKIDCSSKGHIPADGTCEGVEITSHYYRTLQQQLYYYQNDQIYSPILAGDDTVSVNFTLVGKNELYAQPGAGATLQYAHYPMGKIGDGALTINGDGELVVTQSVSGSVNRGACIGGPMLYASGTAVRTGNGKLVFQGGSISAKTNEGSYSAAIGGGSCSPVEKPIIFCGSTVTAQSFNTSAAIGAGGGSSGIGEDAGDIKIESGNITVYSSESGVGIGAGSSEWRSGGAAKNIEISGGKVTVYGADNGSYGKIGGGTSRNLGQEKEERSGGAANITISGGIVLAGTIGGGNTDAQNAKGGDAVIKVKDNANITTESIGGGEATTGKGGNAEVIISGGNLNVKETIGGGNSGSGNGGDASICVSGGTLDCASIGGGNSVSGTPGSVTSVTQAAGVVVTGGTLRTGTIGGGKNDSGKIGFATADISGGTIQGQFILSNTDQNRKCFFYMTGGTIDNKDLGIDKYMKAQTNGGAVYLTDENGEVNISGGTIQNASAELGGAVYMTNGSFTLSGTAAIQNCSAIGNNTNNTLAQGGAVYLDNGTVTMNGGCILSSNATQGGAIYLKKGTVILSNGTIGIEQSPNKADLGAGVYVAGGTLRVNGGSIAYNEARNGAGAYLQSGNMEVSAGQILHNTSLENGAGAYLAGGTLTISSGVVKENTAVQNGGGVFMLAGNMELSGGQIFGNKAVNGAGAYLNGGNLTMNGGGDFDSNIASENGGGAYLAGGALTVDSGAFNSNTAVANGGGAYLADGTLTINGGSFGNNTASNGGGAYASDGKVRMFGGYITNNSATQDGGGFYVSSDKNPADVVIRSGTISGNKAGDLENGGITSTQGNGGAIAVVSNSVDENKDHVVIGLRCIHENLNTTTRAFSPFSYKDDIDNQKEHIHELCPIIKDNQAAGNGGGIYMSSSASALDIYCLLEENDTAKADANGGSIMSVGGNVSIGDTGTDGNGNNTADAVGNILINSKMLVKGGVVKIFGNTDNPQFSDQVLVDIRENAGSFSDYRFTQITDDINYKIEYFENFNGSGMFTAIQYNDDDEISSMGTMYVHEGYKIIGWATEKDAVKPTYTIGETIGKQGDHKAWDKLENTGALKLYAIWQKISYTVVYNANFNNYTGTMEQQSFTYGEKKTLSTNAFKVTGKRFLNWNTVADGSGIAYETTYDESKMNSTDGATVNLYAQWVDCTHNGGDHDGTLSYSLNDKKDTITEKCDCGSYSTALKISGADVYYDGAVHPATLSGKLYAAIPQISYSYSATSDGNYGGMPDGTVEPTNVGYYKASITINEKTAVVEYQIKSAASAATIEVVAEKGQHFTDMKGNTTCTAAQDDAFTIQYQVQALNKGVNDGSKKGYVTAPVLTLSQALPAGTTIIMQTEDSYWYNSNPSGTEIQLASFKKMGGTELFSYTTADSDIADVQTYRFIIDFSLVQDGNYFDSANQLNIGLKYAYTNPQTKEQEEGQDKEAKAAITIDSKAEFKVTVSTDKTNSVTVTAPSGVVDTRWEQKNLAWKIYDASNEADDESETLPSDAKLTLTTTENGSTKTVISSVNQNGEFIIPFDWAESKEFTFSLTSAQESTEDKSYNLVAALYVGSQSQEASQPVACEDNLQKASNRVSLKMPVGKEPALKISSEQKVLLKSDTLKVNINFKNIDMKQCSVTAVIRKKDQSGVYNESSNLGQTSITAKGEQNISLASTNGPGSYCLWVTVSKNNSDGTSQTLLEVPYYFIIQE